VCHQIQALRSLYPYWESTNEAAVFNFGGIQVDPDIGTFGKHTYFNKEDYYQCCNECHAQQG